MPMTIAGPSNAPHYLAPGHIEMLAEELCHLSLKIPAGSVRKNAQAIKLIAHQMDEAIISALGAPQNQGEAARRLMQELLEQDVSLEQIRVCSELEREFPDLRLAIGKISLYYQQCQSGVASEEMIVDRFDGSHAPESSRTASLRPAPAQFVAELAASVSTLPPAPVTYAPMRRSPVRNLAAATPNPNALPLPPVSLAPSPGTGGEDKTLQFRTAPSLPELDAPAAYPVPERLRACLVFFEVAHRAAPMDHEMAFICTQTGREWRDAVIDLRDGQSYERSSLPENVPSSCVVENEGVMRLVDCWLHNHARVPNEFAAALQAAAPHDGRGGLIVDPVVCANGQTWSAQSLEEAHRRGEMLGVADAAAHDSFVCVNHLLVRMMEHFNIGIACDEDIDARRQPGALETSPKERLQNTFNRVKHGCASGDYSEAFNAGLDLNGLLMAIHQTLGESMPLEERRALLSMRAECRRLQGH